MWCSGGRWKWRAGEAIARLKSSMRHISNTPLANRPHTTTQTPSPKSTSDHPPASLRLMSSTPTEAETEANRVERDATPEYKAAAVAARVARGLDPDWRITYDAERAVLDAALAALQAAQKPSPDAEEAKRVAEYRAAAVAACVACGKVLAAEYFEKQDKEGAE